MTIFGSNYLRFEDIGDVCLPDDMVKGLGTMFIGERHNDSTIDK